MNFAFLFTLGSLNEMIIFMQKNRNKDGFNKNLQAYAVSQIE